MDDSIYYDFDWFTPVGNLLAGVKPFCREEDRGKAISRHFPVEPEFAYMKPEGQWCLVDSDACIFEMDVTFLGFSGQDENKPARMAACFDIENYLEDTEQSIHDFTFDELLQGFDPDFTLIIT